MLSGEEGEATSQSFSICSVGPGISWVPDLNSKGKKLFFVSVSWGEVNPSIPQPVGFDSKREEGGASRIDPEWPFSPRASNVCPDPFWYRAGVGATERVKSLISTSGTAINGFIASS